MGLFQRLKDIYMEKPPVVHIQDCRQSPPVRRYYRFSGRVQGVGFRYQASLIACQLGLVGWAQNKADGTVVIEIEGGAANIDEFLRAMQSVSRFRITDIQSKELPVLGTETSFKPLY